MAAYGNYGLDESAGSNYSYDNPSYELQSTQTSKTNTGGAVSGAGSGSAGVWGMILQLGGAGVNAFGQTMAEQRNAARAKELQNYQDQLKSQYQPWWNQIKEGAKPKGFLRGVFASEGANNAYNKAYQAGFQSRAAGTRTSTAAANTLEEAGSNLATDYANAMMGANIKGMSVLKDMDIQQRQRDMPLARNAPNNAAFYGGAMQGIGGALSSYGSKGKSEAWKA